MAGSLNARKVKTAPPGRYSDGAGLLLIVKPNGRRYWIARIMRDGKRRDFGLGSFDDVSLSEARMKAGELRKAVKNGADPLAAKREAVSARRSALGLASERTFRAVAARFLIGHTSTLKSPKHAGLWRSTLETYAYPIFGDRQIDAITGPMVLDALEQLWTRTPETARRVRQRVAAVLDYAHAHGWRGPKPDLAALTAKALPRHGDGIRHHPAVAYDNAPAVVAALHAKSGGMGKLALQFTIYTAARSGETRGATWAEIDVAAKVWSVPAERMKMERPHIVPLSTAALAVLAIASGARLTNDPGELLFPGARGRPISDMTMTAVQRELAPATTVHGWRSTFRDWASETTQFPSDVCEAALAHIVGGKVLRAYQRGNLLDKRIELMTAWAHFLEGVPGSVVSLHQQQAA